MTVIPERNIQLQLWRFLTNVIEGGFSFNGVEFVEHACMFKPITEGSGSRVPKREIIPRAHQRRNKRKSSTGKTKETVMA